MPSSKYKGFQKLPTHDEDECGPSDPGPPQAPPQGLPQAPPYEDSQAQFQPQTTPYHNYPNHPPPYSPAQQVVMVAPGPQTVRVVTDTLPTDWTIPAILACIFCFWPVGIFAIIYANKAIRETRYGNIAEANKCARQAKILTIVSIVVGALIIIVTVLMRVIPIAIAASNLLDAINSNSTLTTTEAPFGY